MLPRSRRRPVHGPSRPQNPVMPTRTAPFPIEPVTCRPASWKASRDIGCGKRTRNDATVHRRHSRPATSAQALPGRGLLRIGAINPRG